MSCYFEENFFGKTAFIAIESIALPIDLAFSVTSEAPLIKTHFLAKITVYLRHIGNTILSQFVFVVNEKIELSQRKNRTLTDFKM